MPLYLGDKEISQIYLGDKELTSIYLGDKEIWGSGKIIALEEGTSWDIKSLYPNLYDSLTVDNFFFMGANTVGASISGKVYPSDYRVYDGFDGGLVKTYNSSTGILSAYSRCNNNKGNAKMAIVIRPDKLIALGTAFSFSLTGYDNYQNFTNDNFLISGAAKTLNRGNTYYASEAVYSYSGSGSVSFNKSYDATTGSLASSLRLSTSGSYLDGGDSCGLTVYLNPKV